MIGENHAKDSGDEYFTDACLKDIPELIPFNLCRYFYCLRKVQPRII